jgi:hypothetical protein
MKAYFQKYGVTHSMIMLYWQGEVPVQGIHSSLKAFGLPGKGSVAFATPRENK